MFFFLAWWGSNGTNSASKAVAGAIAILFLAVVGVVALPLALAVNSLASAAMNHAVNSAFHGEKVSIRGAYRAIWERGWSYIWLYLLEALLVWVAPAIAWLLLILLSIGLTALAARAGIGGAAGALFGVLAVLAVAALIGYAIYMLLRLSLAFPACVVERIGAWDSLKRGSALSRGTRGRVFLLYLLGWCWAGCSRAA